jgi:hypothetical protein
MRDVQLFVFNVREVAIDQKLMNFSGYMDYYKLA